MNQSFYPSCELYHSHPTVKPSHHLTDSHLLHPPPPLLHHHGNDDVSNSFSDECPLTPIPHTSSSKTDMFPTFPEIEDVIHPSDILVLDQPLRKTGAWSEGSDIQEHNNQVALTETYGHQNHQDDVMKDDYVVTSLDDPDVSQRFFAAIDNLLQDYGNAESFVTQVGTTRELEKGPDQIQVSWENNPTLSSFFSHPQQPSVTEMGYSESEFCELVPKNDPFADQKMGPATSYSSVFSISLQQAQPSCTRSMDLELTDSELILPHRTSGHQVPF